MTIRYICSDQESRTDAVLNAVSARAAAEGIQLAGTVQLGDLKRADEKCLIIIGILPDGERRNISFDLGSEATGCRLNPEALEEAVMVVHARLPQAQALVVNKFGRQEASGRGLVSAISEACERGLPVLIGVAPAWREAFLEFAAGSAQSLSADADQVMAWLRAAHLNSVAKNDMVGADD